VSPQVAARRLGDAVRLRPLLASGSPVEALQRLLFVREGLYASADQVIDTEVIELQGVMERVAELARWAREHGG
jgi:hypothetical protein